VDILESLRKNICEVTFTKKNGDERTMICTLIPDFLPSTDALTEYNVAGGNTRGKSDTVTVWDIEESAWRSFKPSTVTDIKFDAE
jgi:hypothetical protein